MIDDITFNAVLIAESLPAREPQTGTILHRYITGVLADLVLPVEPIHVHLESADAFVQLIHQMTDDALNRGFLPILHVEAHGSEMSGLVFADDSSLSWVQICELITPLNRATSFRLVVVVAACYGTDLLDGVRLNRPAPCFAFIAATDEINVGEIMGRFRDLYRTMFTTLDATPTFEAMRRECLQAGVLVPQTAQNWFELLMRQYLAAAASPKGIKEFALRQYVAATSSGVTANMRKLKRDFKRELPNVIRKYFAAYFMFDVPGNELRFAPLWSEMSAEIERVLGKPP